MQNQLGESGRHQRSQQVPDSVVAVERAFHGDERRMVVEQLAERNLRRCLQPSCLPLRAPQETGTASGVALEALKRRIGTPS